MGGLGVLVGTGTLPEQPATASMRPRPASAHSQYFIVLSFPEDARRIIGPMDKDGGALVKVPIGYLPTFGGDGGAG